MITNEDIERAFRMADYQLNQTINEAQYEFRKPEIERTRLLQQMSNAKRFASRGDNPIPEVDNGL